VHISLSLSFFLSFFLSVRVEFFSCTVLYIIHFRFTLVYYRSRNVIYIFIEAVYFFSSSPETI
jgi:hypothetical protein